MLAEKLRRRAREMTMAHYIDLMERAAGELDAEALELESERAPQRTGRRLDIIV